VAFARAHWHWFFLTRPAPLPERLIGADPAAYLRDVMTRGSAGLAPFDPRALAEYERALALRGTAHGICENYRSSAGIDLERDRADRERDRADRERGVRISVPLLALWGRDSVVHRCFQPLDEWKHVASDVRGSALPCGHHIAEEAPDALLVEGLPLMTAV
jgi:haloacetate dehalogenase